MIIENREQYDLLTEARESLKDYEEFKMNFWDSKIRNFSKNNAPTDYMIINEYIRGNLIKPIDKITFPNLYFSIYANKEEKPGCKIYSDGSGVSIKVPRIKTFKDAFVKVRVMSELSRKVQEQSTSDEIKLQDGVIPAFYERELAEKLNYRDFMYHDMLNEAIALSRSPETGENLKRLYAILMLFQYRDQDVDLNEFNTSKKSEEILNEKGYILRPELIEVVKQGKLI